MKFEQLNTDKWVYFSIYPIEDIIIVYVNDIIILIKCKQEYEYATDELAKSFKIKIEVSYTIVWAQNLCYSGTVLSLLKISILIIIF